MKLPTLVFLFTKSSISNFEFWILNFELFSFVSACWSMCITDNGRFFQIISEDSFLYWCQKVSAWLWLSTIYTGTHSYSNCTKCLSHAQLINFQFSIPQPVRDSVNSASSKHISDPISRLSIFHWTKLGTNIFPSEAGLSPTDQRAILSG